jgi:transposase-like protein
VQTFTSEFIDAARAARRATGDRWFADDTYVKVAGRWTYLYRAVDQHGQVIDVLVSERRDSTGARAFFARALKSGSASVQVTTDRRRSTRASSTSWCRAHVASSSGTRTTSWKPIMAV